MGPRPAWIIEPSGAGATGVDTGLFGVNREPVVRLDDEVADKTDLVAVVTEDEYRRLVLSVGKPPGRA